MTLQGTVNKTAMSLVILLIAAAYVWNRGLANPNIGPVDRRPRSWPGSSLHW